MHEILESAPALPGKRAATVRGLVVVGPTAARLLLPLKNAARHLHLILLLQENKDLFTGMHMDAYKIHAQLDDQYDETENLWSWSDLA